MNTTNLSIMNRFIYTLLLLIPLSSFGQLKEKYVHTSPITQSMFVEIVDDNVYYVKSEIRSIQYNYGDYWLMKMNKNLDNTDSLFLSQYFNLSDSSSIYVERIIEIGSKLGVIYRLSDQSRQSPKVYSGLLKVDSNLNVISDYHYRGVSTSVQKAFGLFDVVHWQGSDVAYGVFYHSDSSQTYLAITSLEDLDSLNDVKVVSSIPSTMNVITQAVALSSNRLFLGGLAGYMVVDSNLTIQSSGQTAPWGFNNSIQNYSYQLVSRPGKMPLIFGTLHHLVNGSATPGYRGQLLLLSEADSSLNLSHVDTFDIGLRSNRNGKLFTQDFIDAQKLDSVLFVIGNPEFTVPNDRTYQDSSTFILGSVNSNTKSINWVKHVSLPYNIDSYMMVDRFSNGDLLIGTNEHNWDRFGVGTTSIHWLSYHHSEFLSISEPDESRTVNLIASPNPVGSFVELSGLPTDVSKLSYQLISMEGKSVSGGNISDGLRIEFNRGTISPGMYTLRVFTGEDYCASTFLLFE